VYVSLSSFDRSLSRISKGKKRKGPDLTDYVGGIRGRIGGAELKSRRSPLR